jgi:DNA-binding response OmpR family regulator
VLVIDPDESARSVLEVTLTRDGFEVWSADSGAAGTKLLQGRLPDVIVLESDLGGEEGFSFVSMLRGDERLAKVPVLLLARPDDENVEALADVVGVDDFIRKPAFARDVTAMVRLELARRAGELRFEADALPPQQMLRALLACPRSGRLLLCGGRAEIRFRAGRIIDARFDGKGASLDTVVRALALHAGAYELRLEPVDGFAELQCALREFVDLVTPRLQRWARVQQRSVPLGARFAVDFQRLAKWLKAMPDEVNRVVRLFDGFRTVADVLLDSDFDETVTLEVATRLYLMGVLTPATVASDELLFLRPMPRLFEPRATESEELMQQLFAGSEEIRAEPDAPGADDPWEPLVGGTGLEVPQPDGGWTAAPVPAALSAGLSSEVAKQLEVFHPSMHVEAREPRGDEAAAARFARGDGTVDENSLARSVQVAAERSGAVQEPQACVEASSSVPASGAEPPAAEGQARAVTPRPAPEVAQAGTPGHERVITPLMTPRVTRELEAQFFASADATPGQEADEALSPRRRRALWPFVAAGLVLLGVMLVFDALREEPAPRPASAPPVAEPVRVATPVLPDIEPPEFYADEAEALDDAAPAVEIDVSEPLAEGRRHYEAGRYRQAISVLEQVVTDDPRSVPAWLLLGLARYDAHDAAGALAAAERVLALDPTNGRVQLLLATLHFDAGDRAAGRRALERYLELEPTGAHVEEARALLRR